jgi:hypothetical protein
VTIQKPRVGGGNVDDGSITKQDLSTEIQSTLDKANAVIKRLSIGSPMTTLVAGANVKLFEGSIAAGKSLKVWLASVGGETAGSPVLEVLNSLGNVLATFTGVMSGDGVNSLYSMPIDNSNSTTLIVRLKNTSTLNSAGCWGYLQISIE